jgi:hypothetical protein
MLVVDPGFLGRDEDVIRNEATPAVLSYRCGS